MEGIKDGLSPRGSGRSYARAVLDSSIAVLPQGAQRITDIASHIGTTASPVTISVKRLERENLVKRERSTEDERVVKVQLTKHGRDQFELWRLRRRKALSKIFDPLDENEKNSLLALLSKVASQEAIPCNRNRERRGEKS